MLLGLPHLEVADWGGIYSHQPNCSRWRSLLAMGTPDSPVVTPGFKEQSRVHLIHAPKKTTYIITECIEINVIKHQSIYYIAEDLLQNKSVT
jgi:hypothetical protein